MAGINPNIRKKANGIDVDILCHNLKSGDRIALAKAITIIESESEKHKQIAKELIEKTTKSNNQSIRIGITGIPGVGKSSLIENFGIYLIKKGHKVAVLAIDPSSQVSKGSILGDKTRMEKLSTQQNAFIRPSASGAQLGGVARKTNESILLCEAAGYDIIMVETVGVGQSETTVHSMVDFFILLMLYNAGDELQGIKRGIMEMADAIYINKIDLTTEIKAKQAKQEYKRALGLFPPKDNNWKCRVGLCSANTGQGFDEMYNDIMTFNSHISKDGFKEINRNRQSIYWMHSILKDEIISKFYNNPKVKAEIKKAESLIKEHGAHSFNLADEILNLFA